VALKGEGFYIKTSLLEAALVVDGSMFLSSS
jgi:hypothetical protein